MRQKKGGLVGSFAALRKPYNLAFIAIVVYALLYSVVFVGGPSYYGDDSVYLNYAYQVVHGTFTEHSGDIFSVRLLTILPIALFYKTFGVGLMTDSAWDIASFIGLIAVAFLMGKELYDERAGVVAALLTSFFPMIVMLSATPSDDIPMAFVTALAMLALLYGERRDSGRWYFASGLLLLASGLVTPEGFIICVVAMAYVAIEFLRKRIAISGTTLMLPAGVAFAFMLIVFVNSFYSNPLITFTLNSHFYSAVGGNDTIPSTNTNPMYYINVMFPPNALNFSGFFFYALIAAAIYLVVVRPDGTYFVLFYFLAAFLYLEFGPMHISLHPFSYLLSYRLQRFMTLIAAPLAVAIGIAVSDVAARSGKTRMRLFAYALLALLIFMIILNAAAINLTWYRVLSYERYDQLQAAEFLGRMPNSTIIYFADAYPNIPIYMGFNNMSRFRPYFALTNCSFVSAGAYVVAPALPQNGINYSKFASACGGWMEINYTQPDSVPPQQIDNIGGFSELAVYRVK